MSLFLAGLATDILGIPGYPEDTEDKVSNALRPAPDLHGHILAVLRLDGAVVDGEADHAVHLGVVDGADVVVVVSDPLHLVHGAEAAGARRGPHRRGRGVVPALLGQALHEGLAGVAHLGFEAHLARAPPGHDVDVDPVGVLDVVAVEVEVRVLVARLQLPGPLGQVGRCVVAVGVWEAHLLADDALEGRVPDPGQAAPHVAGRPRALLGQGDEGLVAVPVVVQGHVAAHPAAGLVPAVDDAGGCPGGAVVDALPVLVREAVRYCAVPRAG